MNLRLIALTLAWLTLAVAILPTAGADHAYTHRYVVFGRVVDADGNAVPGLRVQYRFEGLETEGECDPRQRETQTDAFGPTITDLVTSESGDFIICAHAHRMSRFEPGTLVVTIPEADVEERLPVDPYWRSVFLPVQLDEAHPQASGQPLESNYTVVGRAWRPTGEVQLEGIRAWGRTIDQEPVTVMLEVPGQEPVRVKTTTNNYGDFAIRIPVESRLEAGTVRVEVAGETFTSDVSPALGISSVRAELPEPQDTTLRNVLIGLAAIGVFAAAGFFGWRVYNQAVQKRELSRLRESTTRKRANR